VALPPKEQGQGGQKENRLRSTNFSCSRSVKEGKGDSRRRCECHSQRGTDSFKETRASAKKKGKDKNAVTSFAANSPLALSIGKRDEEKKAGPNDDERGKDSR